MRVRGTVRSLVVATMGAACLAGCGVGSQPHASSREPTASQILAQSELALDHVHSFHLQEEGGKPGGLIWHSSVDVVLPGLLSTSERAGASHFTLRLIGDVGYETGNRQYWMSIGVPSDRARILAGRWVKEPAALVPLAIRDYASPTTVGRCMLTLANSTVTLNRMPANNRSSKLVLAQKARPPSRTTAFIFMADHAPWLPRGFAQDGPDTPNPACGEPNVPAGLGGAGGYFSRYNEPVRIIAPARALTLRAVRRIETTPGLAPTAPDGPERKQAAQLNGIWLSRSTVVTSHNFHVPQVGSTSTQVWEFASRCVRGVCALNMVRRTNQSPLVAGLQWNRGHWSASFANTARCADGSVHPETDHVTIWAGGSRLIALERRSTGSQCGQVASSVTVWHARRLLPPPPAAKPRT